jgi:hypothetical protein
MRSDIIPGSKFPDYELSDHTGRHQKLSELQQHPMIVAIADWSRSAPIMLLSLTNFARASARMFYLFARTCAA